MLFRSNVSAHIAHLVGSALSDIYLACSAGLNGLAGPLHGLANQECFKYIQEVCDWFQGVPDKDSLTAYLQQTLSSGRVIPGYGHAVLRSIDPEVAHHHDPATCQTAFQGAGRKSE